MSTPARLPRVGDHFGRYRIDAQIGRGGMGVVYRARDTSIGRTVALKVVSVPLGDDEEFLRRFEREAAVLARLDSPHVIAIFDYGSHDDCPYIATQHVGGGDVGALLQHRGPMPPRLALRVGAQVADALHDAHRVGVVHRDVKPSNVLLRDPDTTDLHAYLCDFGIARTATDGLTAPGAVAGTWSYLAPECGRGAPGTPASDVYALGCLVWATLTGAPPYRGSDVEIAVAHQRAPIPQLQGEDESTLRTNEILRRCLAKDPTGRYPSADQARTALLAAAELPDSGVRPVAVPADQRPTEVGSVSSSPQHLSLGSLPPRTGPPTPTPHRPQPRRRRTALLVGAVCLAVVAVAGGVVAVTTLGADDEASVGRSTDPSVPPATEGTEDSASPASPGSTGGTGSTSAPTTDATPPGPERIDQGGPITGDVDGDGIGELVVEMDLAPGDSPPVGTLTTWSSNGRRFVESREVEQRRTRDDAYRTEVIGDFDGDGTSEVIALEQYDQDAGGDGVVGVVGVVGELSGGGVLQERVRVVGAPLYYVAVGDLDANGSDDLVLRGYVEFDRAPTLIEVIRFVDGEPQRARRWGQAPGSHGETEVAVGDVDGDGRADVISMRRTGEYGDDFRYPVTVTVFRSGRSGMRPGVAVDLRRDSYSGIPVTADIDGDEVDELLLVDTSSSVGAVQVLGWRDGELMRPRTVGTIRGAGSSALSAVAVVDVDGDGRDDLVGVLIERNRLVRFLVARSQGNRFVTSPFGRWRGEFRRGGTTAALRPLTSDFR